MLATNLRHAANVILASAIRIAPPGSREWGQAMRGEISHVEKPWGAVVWALGGAGVLAKHALISLLIPGSRGESVIPGGLFARNVTLRKAAFLASGAFVLGALLFLAAPPFRQGLRVSLVAWNALFHVREQNGQARLQALAKRAEKRHDPEGLVFVAARLWNGSESARLVEEAVHLDPSLIWAYAVVAVRHCDLPEISQWVSELERWDPQNALFPMISAESNDISHVARDSSLAPAERQRAQQADPAWCAAMAAAFASPRFDDYLDRLNGVDRSVVLRYGFNDPLELLSGEQEDLPTYSFGDARRFAQSLLEAGRRLEAAGDRDGAAKKYWAVARFGQVVDSQAHTNDEYLEGAALQVMAYKQLQTLAEKQGDAGEAALFAYLGRGFNPAASQRERERGWVFGSYVSRRNAAVLQISSLMMLVFSGLLIVAASFLIAGRRTEKGYRCSRPGATMIALTSAVGLLLSSATLYLTYRPYWYIFQSAMVKGETSETGDLWSFLMATHTLPGFKPYPGELLKLPVYFWIGVILAGIAGLLLILLQHFRGRKRLTPSQPQPRVP